MREHPRDLKNVEADWVIASGSLPPGVASDFYGTAAQLVRARGGNFALDTSGRALKGLAGSMASRS